MKQKIRLTLFSVLIIGLSACQDGKQQEATAPEPDAAKPELVGDVLGKEQRDAMTPDMVIQTFTEGNERFMKNELTARDYPEQVRKSAEGQHPKAIVLSCVDSRVPVEDVFDKGIGDIFVARVAGNFVNEDFLGSMEFACKVSGAKLILVLGHENCGAVKAAVDDVKLGNITSMLSKIKPAVKDVNYEGERTSKNPEFVAMACESNVKNSLKEIRLKSAILKEMEDKGEIKIVGGVYDLDTGKVTLLN